MWKASSSIDQVIIFNWTHIRVHVKKGGDTSNSGPPRKQINAFYYYKFSSTVFFLCQWSDNMALIMDKLRRNTAFCMWFGAWNLNASPKEAYDVKRLEFFFIDKLEALVITPTPPYWVYINPSINSFVFQKTKMCFESDRFNWFDLKN